MTVENSDDPLGEELSASEAAHKAGDLPALLHAIFVCFRMKRTVPPWAITAFIEAYSKGLRGKLKSWDEVFGHPRTPVQWTRIAKEFEAGPKILDAIAEAKAKGEPIGDDLFERIGRELGIGGHTKVGQIYAYWRGRKSEQ
jgi:hypothetical protein